MTISPRKPVPARQKTFGHLFVEHLPDELEAGVLYVSIRYATAAHKCFCGCSREVITPLHPTKWTLLFDGVSVSLDPSVGSWSLDCKSHYWLERGRVSWAASYSDERIRAVRARDLHDDDRYYAPPDAAEPVAAIAQPVAATRWQKFKGWWSAQ